jgi:nitrite reductase/ring-hydroxylating ferredoxin subunit
MSKHVVAKVEEVPPGASKLVTIGNRQIGIFNLKGEFFALLNRCPHEAGPLCEGKVVGLIGSDGPGNFQVLRPGEMVRCPWHGWRYDIRTGQSWCDPDEARVRRYHVSVEPGQSIVQGPYVAETFSVSVEEKYIVVDV